MESNKILSASLIDILFEGKNKEYGAYELRKTYNGRIAVAITGMASICLLFFLTQLFASGHAKTLTPITVTDLTLSELKPREEVPVPPVKLPEVQRQMVAMVIFTPPVIVNDIDAVDPPPDIQKLEVAQIGLQKQDGTADVGFVAPPVDQTTGAVEGPKKDDVDYEKTFIKVEKEAKFPGGMEAWKKYLERNLNSGVAADNGAPTGNYTVRVQFVVDKEGAISDVEAVEIPSACPGCGPEAVKVIKNGPHWEPAVQNNRKVAYRATQSITFQVAEE